MRPVRLTSDIYPGDLGWTVDWDKPQEAKEWYHNMSSVFQAGPCVRSNQLDYDEDVMFKVGTQASPIYLTTSQGCLSIC